MEHQQVLTIAGNGLMVLLMVCAPVILVVLGIGLVVSIFQAATQINEQTLTFVPKLLAAFATFGLAGPWMISTLVDYIRSILMSIPSVVG